MVPPPTVVGNVLTSPTNERSVPWPPPASLVAGAPPPRRRAGGGSAGQGRKELQGVLGRLGAERRRRGLGVGVAHLLGRVAAGLGVARPVVDRPAHQVVVAAVLG